MHRVNFSGFIFQGKYSKALLLLHFLNYMSSQAKDNYDISMKLILNSF